MRWVRVAFIMAMLCTMAVVQGKKKVMETYIPREGIKTVFLTDHTECVKDEKSNRWNCSGLEMTFVKGSERVRVKR